MRALTAVGELLYTACAIEEVDSERAAVWRSLLVRPAHASAFALAGAKSSRAAGWDGDARQDDWPMIGRGLSVRWAADTARGRAEKTPSQKSAHT